MCVFFLLFFDTQLYEYIIVYSLKTNLPSATFIKNLDDGLVYDNNLR